MGFHNPAAAPQLAYDSPITHCQTATGIGTGINGINGSVGIPGNASTTFGPFDVSQYQSIHLIFNHDIITAHTTTVAISWTTTGNILIAGDTYRWITTDNATLQTQLPVRGDQVSIVVTEGAPGGLTNDSMTMVGSYRPFETLAETVADRVIMTFNQAVGAGATFTAYPTFRYDGPMHFGIFAASGATAAAQPSAFQFFDDTTGNCFGALRDPGVLDGGISRNINRMPAIVAPRNTWHMILNNFGSISQTYQCQLDTGPYE